MSVIGGSADTESHLTACSSRHWLAASTADAAELHNILTLCLDTVDGDTEARAILADLLEESGRTRAADLARSDTNMEATQLSVILGALPGRAVLVLGADFLERVLVRTPHEYGARMAYMYALKKVCRWCYGESAQFPTSPVILFESVSQQELRRGGFTTDGHRPDNNWPLGRAFAHLANGIRCVLAEHEKAPVGDPVWFDQIGAADLHLTAAAKEASEQPASGELRERFNPSGEQLWQLEHTRKFLVDIQNSLDA